MAVMNQILGEVIRAVAREEHNAGTPALIAARQQSGAPSPAPTNGNNNGGRNPNPSSSPLLFFVALGFGVVFTNLWIIVGVKYCFRYNARNRALRNGEDPDQLNMNDMPARPHRRRKEKKLMSMDEVNERFPLTKYKTWVANRLSSGLPAAGGVTAPQSRAASVRDVDGALPTTTIDAVASDAAVTPDNQVTNKDNDVTDQDKPKTTVTGEKVPPANAETSATAGPISKQVSVEDDDDDDDHIHTAVPPELLTNPGDSCAICIDTLEEDDDIRGLTCGHAFHAGCLDPWLTSRRACCPLCKADYYTPKQRTEAEIAADAERAARRRGDARANLPQEPRSTWTGLTPRHWFSARGAADNAAQQNIAASGTRVRRQETQQSTAPATTPEVVAAPAQSHSGWRNPFAGVRLPGRNRNTEQPATEIPQPSPSQLEAGTANTTVVR